MTTALMDPRTETVLRAADDVEHIFCDDCDPHGERVMCGAPAPGDECPGDCGHPQCPMCEIEWENHWCGEPVA